ncbi:hypothetical protein C0Q44_20805 [Paenibacillus sp. PCH8]|uniref:hypothetical protein n=1 Tax=Paenibacillus sp. PCH8 TaxID=2066524 RepID=UPI000CF85B38|nr:hypothetical protein [Paenibacillus sp. PCH8]PQP82095.1 hypothetical protein C0Q44_20805 [Paenibacillus sp. PCH8]
MLTTNEYYFSIRDVAKTSQGYLLMVGSTGSRPLDYMFVYIPYSRYASVLMLDFFMARNAADDTIKEELIDSIKKDLEGEEQFIVLSDGQSRDQVNISHAPVGDKRNTVQAEIEEEIKAMRYRFGANESLVEPIEAFRASLRNSDFMDSPEQKTANRIQELHSAELHSDDAAWRVDNNKELRIFKNVTITRNLLKNLDKIHPSQWGVRFSDQDVILDYLGEYSRDDAVVTVVERIMASARDHQKHTRLEILALAHRTATMLTEQMVIDGALKETERQSIIESVIDSVKERLKDTALSTLEFASSMTRRELNLSYENVLTATKSHHRDTLKGTMHESWRSDQKETDIERDTLKANSSRSLQEGYMEITHKQILSAVDHSRVISVQQPTLGERNGSFDGLVNKFTHALRHIDFETQMQYVQRLGRRKDFEAGSIMRPPLLAKLKTRQFPSMVHQTVLMQRKTKKELLLSEMQLYRRSKEQDIVSLNEIIEFGRNRHTAPTVINKDHAWGIMDNDVQTYMDRPSANRYHLLSALRENRSDPWVIQNHFPEAQRIIDHNSARIDEEFPWGKRIIDHNPAYIEDVSTQIKARRLIVVLGAVEATDKQILASRESTESGIIFREKPEAHRDEVEFAYVERDKPESTRIDKEAAHLLREYSEGRRIDKFESLIEEKFHTGHVGPRVMYLPKTEKHADRIDAYDMKIRSSRLGDRSSEKSIWMPQHLRGDRDEKPLTIEDTVYEALKKRDSRDLFLDDEMYVALKGSRDLNVANIWESLKNITQKHMVYMDELLEKFISDGGSIGNKLYPGHLEDSLLAAELLDRPALVLEMMIDAVYRTDDVAFIDEGLLAGVRERIDALIEVGILSSSKQSESGLITFSAEGIQDLQQAITDLEMTEAYQDRDDAWTDTAFIDADHLSRQGDVDEKMPESIKEKDSDYNQVGLLNEQNAGSKLDHRGETIEVTYADYDAKPIVFNFDNPIGFTQASPGDFEEERFEMNVAYSPEDFGTVNEVLDGYNYNRVGLFDEQNYVTGETTLRSGENPNIYVAGSTDLREFTINEEYSIGSRFKQQGAVSEEYNLGSAVDRELQQTGQIISGGASQTREADIGHMYTSSTSGLRQANTSEGYEWASPLLRQGLYDEEQGLGYKDLLEMHWDDGDGYMAETHSRVAVIADQSTYGLIELKQANMIDDTRFATNSARLSELEGLEHATQLKYSDQLEQIVAVQTKYGHQEWALDLTEHVKDSWINEDFLGQVYKFGNLEQQWVASKYQYGLMDHYLEGGDKPRYADVPVESIGGMPLKYGQIEEEFQSTKYQYGNLAEQLLGIKPQYGKIEEILFSTKPQYGNLEEHLLASKDGMKSEYLFTNNGYKLGRDAYVEEQLAGIKNELITGLEEGITGILSLRRAVVESGLSGIQEKSHAEWEKSIVSDKVNNYGTIVTPSEALKIQQLGHVEEQLYSRKLDQSGSLLNGAQGMKEQADGEFNHYTWTGTNTERHANLAEEITGEMDPRESIWTYEIVTALKKSLHGEFNPEDSNISIKLSGAGHSIDDFSYSEFESRVALVQKDVIAADREDERISHLENQRTEASLANARLSELQNPEDTFATFEERCAQVITGFIFAERPEMRAEYLEQLYAFLPERTAHLMKVYHEAKVEGRSSEIETNSVLAYRDRMTEGYLPIMDTTAQGLVFDYTDNLLDRGMNPEDWEGGFGVPEEYDPHDPFNVYFPYSKEMDALELVQADDWIEFGSGDWKRDELLGKFYSKNKTSQMNGWYRNNFLGDQYKFSVDFKVDANEKGDDGVGIIFKLQDINNYWMFMVNGGDSTNALDMRTPMQLYHVVGGRKESIGSPMQPFKWERDRWYTISVSIMKGKLQIYTDSKLQYDLTGTD